jgi:hypothetical protein
MTSSSVDWRNRFGWPWLTQIKNQGGCGSCYIFSGVGVLEAMLRIEHSTWSLRSEGDVGDSISLFCGAHNKCWGGGPDEVLDWAKANGVADPGCWPYEDSSRVAQPTADRLGRTGKLDGYVWLSGADQMKQWIDAKGPISACFNCYPEFQDACANDSVYIYKNPDNDPPDGHCIVIVGYDDSKQAWLIRNSWTTGWGTNGYGWFGYGQGEHGLENWACIGILGSATNPDPWSKRRMHSGALYESGDGTNHRNFEVWTAGPKNTVRHYYRDGGTGIWKLAETLASVSLPSGTNGYDCDGAPTAIGSTYFRNFEVIYKTTGGKDAQGVTAPMLHHFLFDQLTGKWVDRGTFGPTDVDGVPALIQSNDGGPGNFEVVVRRANGQLENWWRDDVDNNATWAVRSTFGSGIAYSGPTLVERWAADGTMTVGTPAGLDYVCVTDAKTMQRWWRDDPNTMTWVACETFGSEVQSQPAMIRSQFGATDETVPGNYELCVAVNGSIQHWWAPGNPQPGQTAKWAQSATFGTDQKGQTVTNVLGLIESSYGFDLEVVAQLSNGGVQHFWRDGAGWHPGPVFGSVTT